MKNKMRNEGGGIHGQLEMGCGKGRKCDISLYIMPQASTQEYFNTYTAERLETMRQDGETGGKS